MPIFDETEENKRIDFLHRQEEEELARMLAPKYGVGYVDLSLVAINTDAIRLIAEAEARDAEIAAFGRVGKKVSLAVRSPEHPKAKAAVAKLEELGYTVSRFMASRESLARAYDRYKDLSYATESKAGVFELSSEEIAEIHGKVRSVADIGVLIGEAVAMKRAYRVTRVLEIILAGGLSTGASDIHLEPEEGAVRLRYRLDGVLVDVLTIDRETYRLLLSRMKLLSGLKLNIIDEAQDGRFSIKHNDAEIEIRSSILPGAYAETVVLRILDPKSIGVPLEELGIDEKLLPVLLAQIEKPNGMLLTTGPTGSGKTTTLYAFLKKINKPGTKIVTIEDPVEYHLPGIVQTQVDKKNYTFSQGLRSALRQDPDIIMVGEIRDREVAEVAINAALTGHLVFSTLHTNNAAGSFPRLIDLDVNPKIIGSAVTVAMAQRLIRKLCSACKKKRAATPAEFEVIKRVTDSIPDKARIPAERGIVYEAPGCPECGGDGFKGRTGLYEAILMDGSIEKMLAENPSERDIAEAARGQGLLTMKEDGVLKVLKGITSLEELGRIIDLA